MLPLCPNTPIPKYPPPPLLPQHSHSKIPPPQPSSSTHPFPDNTPPPPPLPFCHNTHSPAHLLPTTTPPFLPNTPTPKYSPSCPVLTFFSTSSSCERVSTKLWWPSSRLRSKRPTESWRLEGARESGEWVVVGWGRKPWMKLTSLKKHQPPPPPHPPTADQALTRKRTTLTQEARLCLSHPYFSPSGNGLSYLYIFQTLKTGCNHILHLPCINVLACQVVVDHFYVCMPGDSYLRETWSLSRCVSCCTCDVNQTLLISLADSKTPCYFDCSSTFFVCLEKANGKLPPFSRLWILCMHEHRVFGHAPNLL